MTDPKLTPREPTPSMVEAGLVWTDFARGVWRAMHDAAPNVEVEPTALAERWVVVRQTALDVGYGDDVRTGGKPELGYALIRDAATFTSEHAALAAIRSCAKPLPLGWVVMRLSRLLPDLYTHPAAPQPAALPEPDYKAGEKGMLGEDCYSAATVRAYGEACARAALKGEQ